MLLTVLLPVAPAMDWRRTFPGRADQAHEVRAFAATLIPDHPRLDDVLFSVGELVANALRHTKSGRGGSFTVDLLHTGGRTAVSVADEGGPAQPVADEAGERSECGRGLRTVSLLADSWGWHGNDTGRTVTAVFAADTPTRPQMTNPGLRIRTTSRTSGRCGWQGGSDARRRLGGAEPMTSGYERELAELRKALELPIVGHPHCGAELAELRRLIEKYADQARQMVAKADGRQTVDPCQDRDEMTWGGMRISVNSVGAFGSRRNSLMTAYYEIRHRMFRNSAPGMRGAR